MTIDKLFSIIEERKKQMPEKSYATSLFREGKDRVLQKVGEETIELMIAAKGRSKKRIIEEIADLWFHSLVLMASLGITPIDVFQELEKRRKN